MTPIQSAELDHVLSCWHYWAKAEPMARGFNTRAAVVGDCRGYGLQYESQLEDQYVKSDNARWRDTDFQIRHMAEPYRTAIYLDAKALYTGLAVWKSPRLPTDPQEVAVILKAGRQILVGRLIGAGVME